jgi:hypothetical protein
MLMDGLNTRPRFLFVCAQWIGARESFRFGITIPLSRRALAPDFFIGANARRQNMITSNAKPVRSKERAGVGLSFSLPYLVS